MYVQAKCDAFTLVIRTTYSYYKANVHCYGKLQVIHGYTDTRVSVVPVLA